MESMIFYVIVLLAASSSVLSQPGELPPSRDPCPNFPCKNGGTCVSPFDKPICQCPSGYAGDRCEIIVRSVKFGRCGLNVANGSCVAERQCNADFNCPGSQKCCYSMCERVCTDDVIIDPCDGYCKNGGKCTAPADAPKCTCINGFYGNRCEIKPNPGTCPQSNPLSAYACSGITCSKDRECQCDQKCCETTITCGKRCTAVSQPAPPPPPPITCANVLCAPDTVCRHVIECESCPLKPVCLHPNEIPQGIDEPCRRMNYSEVVLIVDETNTYDHFKCRSKPNSPVCRCPSGSDCVNGSLQGGGMCCKGRIIPRPRSCPDKILTCGGVLCQRDAECPGNQKCCRACGAKQCSEPKLEVCGNRVCQKGEVCEDKQQQCPAGMSCIQALLPTCVPYQCEICAYNEVCRQIGSQYVCVPP